MSFFTYIDDSGNNNESQSVGVLYIMMELCSHNLRYDQRITKTQK